MKAATCFLTLFALMFACNAAVTPKKIIHFPAEKSEELLEWTLKCISKGGFDSSVLEFVKEGKYIENEQTLQALVCANTNIGYGYENGRINKEKIMTELFYNKADIRAVLDICDKEYGQTPEANLKGVLLCFRENLPYKVRL